MVVLVMVLVFGKNVSFSHKVYKLPGFLSSRPNWVPHLLLTRKRVLPPLWVQGRRHTRLLGDGGPNSDDGTDILVL
jgi:hypothetical protein